MSKKIFFLGILFIIPLLSIGQATDETNSYQTYFGSFVKPIEVKIEPFNGKFNITAFNSTLYPFTTTIELTLKNMRCDRPLSFSHLILPGTNMIGRLNVLDDKLSYSYDFKFSYKIGNPFMKFNDTITYLIPFKPERNCIANPSDGIIQKYTFKCSAGDTIYASRKGIVCATPLDSKDHVERYSFSNNFEVYQNDGTIAIYKPLSKVFKKRGETIIPGEAIGIAYDEFFFLNILQFNENSAISYAKVNFITDKGKFSSFYNDDTIKPIHPRSIIMNELTRREKKRFLKSHI